MRPVIEQAEALPGAVVALTWQDGLRSCVDMKPYIARGGRFRLLDDPARFSSVRIGRQGRVLYWLDDDGDEIDFSADLLRQESLSSGIATGAAK